MEGDDEEEGTEADDKGDEDDDLVEEQSGHVVMWLDLMRTLSSP